MTPEEVNEMFKRTLEESGVPYVEGGKAFEYEDLFPDFENLPTLEEYIEWRENKYE